MGANVSVPKKIRIGRGKKKEYEVNKADSEIPTAVIVEEEGAAGTPAENGAKTNAEPGASVETNTNESDTPEADEMPDKPKEVAVSEDIIVAKTKDRPKPGDTVVTEIVNVQSVQSSVKGRPVEHKTDGVTATMPVDEAVDVPSSEPEITAADKPAEVFAEPAATDSADKSADVEPEVAEPVIIAVEKSADVESEPVTVHADKSIDVPEPEASPADKSGEVQSEPLALTTAAEKSGDVQSERATTTDDKSADAPTETPPPVVNETHPEVQGKTKESATVDETDLAPMSEVTSENNPTSADQEPTTTAVVDKPTETPISAAAEPPTSGTAELTPEPEPEDLEVSPREKLQDLIPYIFEKFPFDNVVFQGAARGRTLGNVGAFRVLEEAGISGRIKRIAGTSSGAMTAALVAVGYDSYELEKFFANDIHNIMADHKFGLLSLVPNLIKSYGWNPGHRLYNWFGLKMKERTGNADITFQQVYEKFGHELCIVATNLNQMMAEYCHPKTTPDMPVRLAVRMSASIPGFFKPVSYKRNGKTELFVDGGPLCNYPIHCYDGWWLSMKPEDQFLKKMQPLSSRNQLLLDDNERFGGYNAKTIGFLLYAEHERDVFQSLLDERMKQASGEPTIPDTKLSRSHNERNKNSEEMSGKHTALAASADKFLQALKKQGLDKKTTITKEELEEVISEDRVAQDDLKVLFGEKVAADDIFEKLENKKGDGFDYGRIAMYLEQRGLDLQAGYMAEFKSHNIGNLKEFLLSLKETMVVNMQRHVIKTTDIERTVGINTHYIGTLDFNLEAADKEFLIEQGRRATVAFLRHYADLHLQDFRQDPVEPFSRDDLQHYIDDDLSEIIDPRDYSEKPTVKSIKK